jgi:hypothetical protein
VRGPPDATRPASPAFGGHAAVAACARRAGAGAVERVRLSWAGLASRTGQEGRRAAQQERKFIFHFIFLNNSNTFTFLSNKNQFS